ncbi:hypothetical protein JCM10212_006751 [Sporobolomyces blumeae]
MTKGQPDREAAAAARPKASKAASLKPPASKKPAAKKRKGDDDEDDDDNEKDQKKDKKKDKNGEESNDGPSGFAGYYNQLPLVIQAVYKRLMDRPEGGKEVDWDIQAWFTINHSEWKNLPVHQLFKKAYNHLGIKQEEAPIHETKGFTSNRDVVCDADYNEDLAKWSPNVWWWEVDLDVVKKEHKECKGYRTRTSLGRDRINWADLAKAGNGQV